MKREKSKKEILFIEVIKLIERISLKLTNVNLLLIRALTVNIKRSEGERKELYQLALISLKRCHNSCYISITVCMYEACVKIIPISYN